MVKVVSPAISTGACSLPAVVLKCRPLMMPDPLNGFLGLRKRNIVDPLFPNSKYSALPYDSYSPSVKTKVTKRVCKKCDVYYPSIAALKRHHKVCSSGIDTVDEESSDEEVEQITEVEMEEETPIMNIFDILQNSAFVEVENEKDVGAF